MIVRWLTVENILKDVSHVLILPKRLQTWVVENTFLKERKIEENEFYVVYSTLSLSFPPRPESVSQISLTTTQLHPVY